MTRRFQLVARSVLLPGLILLASGSQSLLAEQVTSQSAKPAAAIMAYGRFVPEREDDFTWENDKVAFRVYGPSSGGKGQVSGVDAWLKKVPWSVIDKWYADHLTGKSYHVDHGEGYDPYHVGDSRGVGGTAVWIDGVPWPAGKYKSYEVLQNRGSVVAFRLQYEWDTPMGAVAESKAITLRLGEQLYEVHSVFTLNGKAAALPIAIGLTTHDERARVLSNNETGRIATWETIDGSGLGTGALLEPDRVTEILHLPSKEKDESHVWLITLSNERGELNFRAGFAWEAAGDITSPEQWAHYLDTSTD